MYQGCVFFLCTAKFVSKLSSGSYIYRKWGKCRITGLYLFSPYVPDVNATEDDVGVIPKKKRVFDCAIIALRLRRQRTKRPSLASTMAYDKLQSARQTCARARLQLFFELLHCDYGS